MAAAPPIALPAFLALSPIELAVRATGPCDDLERLDGALERALERGDRALERRRLEPRDALLRGRLEPRDAFPRELLDARERDDLDEAARVLDELARVGLDEPARPLADEADRGAVLRAPFLPEVDRAAPFLLVEAVLVWAILGTPSRRRPESLLDYPNCSADKLAQHLSHRPELEEAP